MIFPTTNDVVGGYGKLYFNDITSDGSNCIVFSEDGVSKNNLHLLANTDVILITGHGDYAATVTEKGNLFDVGSKSLFFNKTIFAPICKSGKTLGDLVSLNEGTFIGYKEDFEWFSDEQNLFQLKDIYAYPFWEIQRCIFLNILNGIDIYKIKNVTKSYYSNMIDWVKNNSEYSNNDKQNIIDTLIRDFNNLVIKGDYQNSPQEYYIQNG